MLHNTNASTNGCFNNSRPQRQNFLTMVVLDSVISLVSYCPNCALYGLFLFPADSLFLATISAESVPISDGDPIIWDSALLNPGGHFSTVLGAYEAPVDGYYQ